MRPLTHVKNYLRKEHPYLSKLPIIGKGAFSIVYEDGPDKVLKVSVCPAFQEVVNYLPIVDEKCPIQLPVIYDYRHLTNIELHNPHKGIDADLNVSVYQMERYKPFGLTKVDKNSAYYVREYDKLIRRIPYTILGDSERTYHWIVDEIRKASNVCDEYVHFIESLAELSLNIDKEFDLYKRGNFGINSKNQAVLLDPLFDMKFNRYLYHSGN